MRWVWKKNRAKHRSLDLIFAVDKTEDEQKEVNSNNEA